MEEVIRNLKEKEIIYRKSIEVLKKYIENKYPEANEQFRAQVFADAIHKIIDDHIREFRRSDQLKIKHDLLIRTATKENFEIVAYDIMKTCVALEIDEETFVSNLTSWINRQQDIPVYRGQMEAITTMVRADIEQETLGALIAQQETLEKFEEPLQDEDVDLFDDELLTKLEKDTVKDESLLEQLEAAFEYEPSDLYDDENKPELFTQGVINEAYEAELRKDLFQNGHLGPEEFDPAETIIIHDLDMAKATESFVNHDLIDQVLEEDEQRPIIKVTMDQEPYFSDTPELWEASKANVPIGERIRTKLGAYSRKTLIMALVGVVGILIIIALIIGLIHRLMPSETRVDGIEVEVVSTSLKSGDIVEPLSLEPGKVVVVEEKQSSKETLHQRIRYKEVDEEALKGWFKRNGSKVGDSPYFETILEVAEDYGVNPLLLFAITGQEQGFVPLDHEFSEQMINNPFNVYGSWETYNTDIKESAQIASRTVLTASESRPEDIDPIVWINETYAEDENWSTGVTIILEQLEAVAGY